MIANKIIDSSHLVMPENGYIVDTNMLLYMYGNEKSTGNKERLGIIMAKALDMKCNVYVPAIVISEFIKVFHRKEFAKINKQHNKDFKRDYQLTALYNSNNEFLLKTIKDNIFSVCKLIGDNFETTSLDDIFGGDANQTFNDNLIIKIENENNLYIISDDIDTRRIKYK